MSVNFLYFFTSVYKRFKNLTPIPEAVTKKTKLSRDELFELPELKVRMWPIEKNETPYIYIIEMKKKNMINIQDSNKPNLQTS